MNKASIISWLNLADLRRAKESWIDYTWQGDP